jgi:chemotaxis protein MotB
MGFYSGVSTRFSDRKKEELSMGRLRIVVTSAFLCFLLTAGCASTDWESQYLEKDQEARALQAQYDLQRQALAEREAMNEEVRAQYEASLAQVDELQGKVNALKDRPAQPAVSDRSAEESARLQAEIERLRKQNLGATLTPDGNIEITLESDVSFASGSHGLTKQGKSTLDAVARELKGRYATNQVRVIGHTDSDPIRKSPYKDNWELGSERALGVIRYLHDQHGVEADRLVAASRGENSPVSSNASKESKAKNRRVEIVVIIPRQDIVGLLDE